MQTQVVSTPQSMVSGSCSVHRFGHLDMKRLVFAMGRLLELSMWNRRQYLSASDLETVSYATRRVAKALAEALHWQIIVLRGFLIPIINTIFIELSTTAYLMIFFFPRLILRLNLLHCLARARQIESPPKPVSFVPEVYTSLSWGHSSAHCSNGDAPVFRYLNTR